MFKIKTVKYIHGLFLFILINVATTIHASDLKISIFNDYAIQSVVFSSFDGHYNIYTDDVFLKKIEAYDLVYISLMGSKVNIRDRNSNLGAFTKIEIVPENENSFYKLKPINPIMDYRLYFDAVQFSASFGKILIVNKVSENHYLAGVVITECGANRHVEFYKAQSIIARTFAIKNLDKHTGEGFNLCDGVHCQAYKSLCIYPDIIKAVEQTSDLVITDDKNELISAAFHANCGGQTQNADNVWQKAEPCLVSVNDPFCTKMPGAVWEKKIPLEEWNTYIQRKGVDINKITSRDLYFEQPNRQPNYIIRDYKIPFLDIRKDLNLRSAFFSVKLLDETHVLLQGKGYGHGVGMCQEGAMQMARQGYKYNEIISFYYRDVKIVPFIIP